MSSPSHETLNRLQNESRIPIGIWRHWCAQLDLGLDEAVAVWEEICRPLLLVLRQIPDVAFILQLRALRPDLDIVSFREELPILLQIFALLPALEDECLSGEKIRRSILRLYGGMATSAAVSKAGLASRFLFEFCSAVLLAKVLERQQINLNGVLKVLAEGRLGDLAQWGLKVADEAPYRVVVQACLEQCAPTAEGGMPAPEKGRPAAGERQAGYPADMGAYLADFQKALQAIYIDQAGEEMAAEDVGQLLADRLQAIAAFTPLRGYIPSAEEAWSAIQRTDDTSALERRNAIEQARGPDHPAAGRGETGPRTAAWPESSRSRAGVPSGRPQLGRAPGVPGPGRDRSEVAGPGSPRTGDRPGPGDALLSLEEEVTLENHHRLPFDAAVRQIGNHLAELEATDATVWALFLDPSGMIEAPRVLARELCTAGSSARQAGEIVKAIARWQSLKGHFSLPADRRLQTRGFPYDVRGFVNFTTTSHHRIEPDSRVLIPLPRILDSASATLMRLQGLEECLEGVAEEEEIGLQTIIDRCTRALEGVVQRIDDQEMLAEARRQGDADIAGLLEEFAAERRVDGLLATCRAYVQTLEEKGHLISREHLETALAAQPLVGAADERQDLVLVKVPERLREPSGLGEVFDCLRQHLVDRLAPVLPPLPDSGVVWDRLDQLLRRLLLAHLVLPARRERHHRNPRVALSVVGLDKVTGNPELASLFVRLRVDGRLLFVEGFERGEYVDLFELRTHRRAQLRARTHGKAADARSDELQLGARYLYSVGRTNQLFGRNSEGVKNSCLQTEDGRLKIFPIFA